MKMAYFFFNACFLCYKGLSRDGVAVTRGAVVQEMRPGVGFKISHFVEEKLGGLTDSTIPPPNNGDFL